MAARYWVGGTSTWDATAGTKWALTSGGAGGQAVPTTADDVFFTNLSTGVCTIGTGYTPQCLTINFTGHTGSLVATTQQITVAGSGTVYTGSTTNTTTNLTFNLIYNATLAVTIAAGAVTSANSSVFNITSTTASYNLTIANGSALKSLTFVNLATVNIINTAVTFYGNVTIGTNTTLAAGTNAWTFGATASLNTAGKTFDFPVTINATGGTVTLATNGLTLGSTRALTLTAGTFATSSLAVSVGIFSSNNSNTRTLNLGTTVMTLSNAVGASTVVLDGATLTGMTLTTSGGGFTRANTASATLTWGSTAGGSSATAVSMNITSGASALAITAGSHFSSLTVSSSFTSTVTGSANIYTGLTLPAGPNYSAFGVTLLGTMTFNMNLVTLANAINALTINAPGGVVTCSSSIITLATATTTLTAGTLALSTNTLTTGFFSSSNSNTRTISAVAGASISANGSNGTVWNTGTTTNLTMPAINLPITCGGAGSSLQARTIDVGTGWTSTTSPSLTVSGGTSVLDAVTVNGTYNNITYATNSTYINGAALSLYGNFTIGATSVHSPGQTNAITFVSTATGKTVTTNGVTINSPMTFNGVGGGWTLGGALTMASTQLLTLTAGTLTMSTFSISTAAFSSNNSNTRALANTSGTMTLTGTNRTIWDTATTTGLTLPTNLSVTANGSGTVGQTRTVNSGTLTASAAINFTVTAGADGFTYGTSTFNNWTISGYTGTMSTGAITIYGDLSVTSACTFGPSGSTITFAATTTGKLINCSRTIDAPVTFNGVGGGWSLSTSSLTLGATRTLTLLAGALSLNSLNISTGFFSASGSSTRSLAFGTTNITITGTTFAGAVIDIAAMSGFTATDSGGGFIMAPASVSYQIDLGTFSGGSSSGACNVTYSGTGTSVLTILTGCYIKAFNANSTSATVTGSANIYGAVTLGASGTFTGLTLTTRATANFAGNGKTITALTVNAPSATTTMTSNVTMTGALTLTAGTLGLGTTTITANTFTADNINTRAITTSVGSGAMVITNTTGGTVFTVGTVTSGLTMPTNLSVTLNGAAGAVTRTINAGALGFSNSPSFSISAGAGNIAFTANNQVYNLNFTGFTGTLSNVAITVYGTLFTLAAGMSLATGSNTMTFGGINTQSITTAGKTLPFPIDINGTNTFNMSGGAVTVSDTVTLTQGTINVQSSTLTANVFSSSGSGTRALARVTGGMTITGSGTTVFNIGVSTGLTMPSGFPVTLTYSGGTGTRTIDSAALSALSPSFTFSAGSDTVTFTAGDHVYNLDFSAYSGTWAVTTMSVYGTAFTLSSAMSLSGANTVTFAATGTTTVTTNGETITFPIDINNTACIFSLSGAFTSTSTVTLTGGTFQTNSSAVTLQTFTTTGAGSKSISLGTSTVTLNSSWTATGAGKSTATETINANAVTTNFTGGGLTYGTLNLALANGTLNVNDGGNTIAAITNTANPVTLNLASSTTNTISSTFSLGGTISANSTLKASTSGSQATISKASGTVSPTYLTIVDSNATGGAVWQGNGTGTVNGGNNTGWIFSVTYNATVLEVSSIVDSTLGRITFGRAVTETATITDSTLGRISFGRAVTETATITDSGTPKLTRSGTVAETATATDADFGRAVFRSAVIETDTATDTTNKQLRVNRTVTETATITDSGTSGLIFRSAVTETDTATDTTARTVSLTKAVAETATITDVGTSRMVFRSAVSETETATDSDSAQAVFLSAVVETDTATDSIIGGLALSKAVEETGAVTDLSAGGLVFSSYIDETDSATDLSSWQLVVATSISEAATVTDSNFGQVVFVSPVAESATATDANASQTLLLSFVAETATITDSTLATLSITNLISESVTIVDTTDQTLILSTSVAELLVVADTMAPGFNFSLAVAEVAAGADTTFAVANLYKAVAETSSVLDSSSSTASIYKEVAETAFFFTDAMAARVDFVSTAAESALAVAAPRGNTTTNNYVVNNAAAADAVLSAFLWNDIDDSENADWQPIANPQTAGWTPVNDSQTVTWQNVPTTQTAGWTDVNDVQTPGWTPIQQIP